MLAPCALALAACSSGGSGSSHAAGASSAAAVSAAKSQGGGDGNINLSSDQVAAKYMAALESATTLHAEGTTGLGDNAGQVDLYGEKNGNAKGTLSSGGDSFDFISFDGVGYIQYNAEYEHLAKLDPTSQAGKLLLNKWAPSNTTAGSAYNAGVATVVKGLTDFAGLTGSGDTYTYLGTTTVDGQKLAKYEDDDTDPNEPPQTDFAVPVSGPMLPVLLTPGGGSNGTLTLTWNQPVQIAAPPASELIKTIP